MANYGHTRNSKAKVVDNVSVPRIPRPFDSSPDEALIREVDVHIELGNLRELSTSHVLCGIGHAEIHIFIFSPEEARVLTAFRY